MKKIFYLITGALILASCQHDVVYEVDYNITLDSENTFYAGDPVKFNIDGEVDNLLFYSGETGSQYIYKDRYEVPIEDVTSANLHLDIRGRYGFRADQEALEVWVSKDFQGINGSDDPDGDRALVAQMVADGMPGWTKLDQFVDQNKDQFFGYDIPMNDYLDNLCIAFHWNTGDKTKTQRTFWINGKVSLEMKGTEPSQMSLTSLGMKSLMMCTEVDAYHKNAGNGSIRFDNATNAGEICFQGCSANEKPYAIDGWVFTNPRPLNKVANDKGTVIKDLQNYLHSYEYTWETPGTYKVTFVGRNENYAHASEEIKEMTITILEKPEE